MDKEIARKMEEFGFRDADGNVIRPYDVFTIEEIKDLQKRGREELALEGGSN